MQESVYEKKLDTPNKNQISNETTNFGSADKKSNDGKTEDQILLLKACRNSKAIKKEEREQKKGVVSKKKPNTA